MSVTAITFPIEALESHYLKARNRAATQDTLCGCFQRHVDDRLRSLFVADPERSATHLLELYQQRSQYRVNIELQAYTCTLLSLVKFPLDGPPSERECTRVSQVMEQYRVYSFLKAVLSHDRFLRENPVSSLSIHNAIR